ncbi:hypothetical protein LCGC14_1262890 [marine sediment metagenome]|uniref:Uncharacterized protein n=1 Tax=marine sediment metagenome TaxID=412755 RepID=A0A0F9LLK0_9ZZZZ
MKCQYGGGVHSPNALCLVSRRKFFFIGGGVLGAALAAPAIMWAPYRLPCATCAGDIVTYSRKIADATMEKPNSLWGRKGFVWPGLPGTTMTTRWDPTALKQLGHNEHTIEYRLRCFTGTRNWLANLAT